MSIVKFLNEDVLLKAGYNNLGWLNIREISNNAPTMFLSCREKQHTIEELSYSQHKNLCVCNICKIYWYYDSSD